jgi:seryl-tRNA synthetase
MLDLKFIRENPDAVRAACVKKRIEVDLDRLLALDRDLRDLRREQEALRTEQNAKSKEIPKLAPAERAVALEATKELSNRLKEFDAKVKVLEDELKPLLLRVPNIPAPEVPDGKDDTENVEIKRVGTPPDFSFKARGPRRARRARTSSTSSARRASPARARTSCSNDGALLALAVLKFALDHMVANGFTPMLVPPHGARRGDERHGYLPGGEEQAYRSRRTRREPDRHRRGAGDRVHGCGEILDHSELPKKYVGGRPASGARPAPTARTRAASTACTSSRRSSR